MHVSEFLSSQYFGINQRQVGFNKIFFIVISKKKEVLSLLRNVNVLREMKSFTKV